MPASFGTPPIAWLLQSIESPTIDTNIPASLRDPEDRWVGLSVRARTIAGAPNE